MTWNDTLPPLPLPNAILPGHIQSSWHVRCSYCLLSRSSLRVKDSELKPGQQYATMSDDLIVVHAALELGRTVSRCLHQ